MSLHKTIPVFALSLFLLLAAAPALAASPSAPTAMQLSTELSQIQSELQTASTSSSAPFTFSLNQSLQIAPSNPSAGPLTITLTNFLHTKTDPTIPPIQQQPVTNYAEISLNYQPCTLTSPAECVPEASSSYPVMTSIMSVGQSTGYLHYLISLTALSSTTATFTITDTAYLSEIQNALQTLATQVQEFLGK
jgi:hypothetical protein